MHFFQLKKLFITRKIEEGGPGLVVTWGKFSEWLFQKKIFDTSNMGAVAILRLTTRRIL